MTTRHTSRAAGSRHLHRRANGRLRALRALVSVATTLVLSAVIGGAAFAVWSVTGAGSGTATAGSTVALTTSSVTAPDAGAYPGGPAVALALVVSNPNGVPVQITAVSLDTTRQVTVTGASGTCVAPPVSVSATGLAIPLPANASNASVSVPAALTLGATTASGCQGATFTVPVVLSGRTP
ncbi:hypothetical protein [Phycicoccus sp. Root101]|uniref:hypothetical protein n=1 Tax=Phycicoccus sp. Root101 TaxID=1736421 RepID=UPI0007023D27|nr:hypothetical protein [Phycicoccus sp. Root101]KQU65429.1 hypothetical protein ASC58_18320 [Phycicoccus sp. Root101]